MTSLSQITLTNFLNNLLGLFGVSAGQYLHVAAQSGRQQHRDRRDRQTRFSVLIRAKANAVSRPVTQSRIKWSSGILRRDARDMCVC